MTVKVNGREMCDSPFSVFVHVPPAQLKQPVRRIKGLNNSWGIAINEDEEVLVAEKGSCCASVFNKQGKKLRTIKHKDLPEPSGVAVDPDGNIYISNSKDSVVKFSRDGQPLLVNKNLGPDLHFMQVISGTLHICSSEHVLLVACEDLHLITKIWQQGNGKKEKLAPHFKSCP